MTDYHLKYGADGHLLFGAAGHLVNECAPPPENTCNTCEPPIPDTLYATFAGLGGDFAAYNGKHTLQWGSGASCGLRAYDPCCWFKEIAGGCPTGYIFVGWNGTDWHASVHPANNCGRTWRTTAGGLTCDPTGAYSLMVCLDSGCGDKNSCAESAGATCVVSLT